MLHLIFLSMWFCISIQFNFQLRRAQDADWWRARRERETESNNNNDKNAVMNPDKILSLSYSIWNECNFTRLKIARNFAIKNFNIVSLEFFLTKQLQFQHPFSFIHSAFLLWISVENLNFVTSLSKWKKRTKNHIRTNVNANYCMSYNMPWTKNFICLNSNVGISCFVSKTTPFNKHEQLFLFCFVSVLFSVKRFPNSTWLHLLRINETGIQQVLSLFTPALII